MLVLSRKVGERIFVPELEMIVTVVAVTGGKVRLGFSAPPEVAIYREEVCNQKPASGLAAPAKAILARELDEGRLR